METVRFVSPKVALVDGRYIQKGAEGGKNREMGATIALRRVAGGWCIAAIRNVLSSAPPPG